MLDPSSIIEASTSIKHTKLVPFARNLDDDFIATRLDEHQGQVFYASSEGDIEGEELASCLAVFLEHYRDKLLRSRLEFVEDCGMVEKEGKPSKK